MGVDVSVIMAAYNCEDTIKIALDSLLEQTMDNWELIVCDDGSTDHTTQIVDEYSQKYPERIRFLFYMEHMGLNYSLNYCLRYARGTYIACMYADGISVPNRLEKEKQFLDEHPQIDIVSCPLWNPALQRGAILDAVVQYPKKEDLVRGTPFLHESCMIRARAIRKVNGYREELWTRTVEGYDLWFRMYAAGFRGANLGEPLYMMQNNKDHYHRRTLWRIYNEAKVRYFGYKSIGLTGKNYLNCFRSLLNQ